tara:strand:- start:112 stop:561 length:450 start_codon:yes stop_codon:yes gene_type:complete
MALITFANKVDSQTTGVAEINKITASNINQIKAGVNTNETAINNLLPFTSLVQLLTQTGTNTPVATEVYNNTGETFTWSYVSQGVYRITSTNTLFTVNKTVVFANLGSYNTGASKDIAWNRISDSIIEIGTTTSNDTITNGSFEVKIYN